MYRLDVMSLLPKFCSFHFPTQDLNCVSNLGQIVYFLYQELLFQLSYHVTHKLVVHRVKFVVHVHVLNEVSMVLCTKNCPSCSV